MERPWREENEMNKIYKYEATVQKVPDIDGAYVEFPYDVKIDSITLMSLYEKRNDIFGGIGYNMPTIGKQTNYS